MQNLLLKLSKLLISPFLNILCVSVCQQGDDDDDYVCVGGVCVYVCVCLYSVEQEVAGKGREAELKVVSLSHKGPADRCQKRDRVLRKEAED